MLRKENLNDQSTAGSHPQSKEGRRIRTGRHRQVHFCRPVPRRNHHRRGRLDGFDGRGKDRAEVLERAAQQREGHHGGACRRALQDARYRHGRLGGNALRCICMCPEALGQSFVPGLRHRIQSCVGGVRQAHERAFDHGRQGHQRGHHRTRSHAEVRTAGRGGVIRQMGNETAEQPESEYCRYGQGMGGHGALC